MRNILLGIEDFPNDIDITGVGHPDDLRNNIDKEKYSAFRTEKYGTITVIPEKKTNQKEQIQYELTPFRSEDDYTDNRHPDTIQRSDNLLDDSKRRDFSINSLYYTQITYPFTAHQDTIKNYDEETFCKQLKKEGFIYINDLHLLIINNGNLIKKIIVKGEIKKEFISYLLNTTRNTINFVTQSEAKSLDSSAKPQNDNEAVWVKKTQKLQILIDPNNGINDMIQRKITAIGTAEKRLEEDALRIIRAVRFTSVLNQQLKNINNTNPPLTPPLSKKETKEWNSPLLKGDVPQSGTGGFDCKQKIKNNNTKITLFDIEKNTRLAMKNKKDLINNIAKERIKDEITKSFAKGSGFVFIALADELGLLPILFPALYKTKHDDQPVRYHPFDTYAHTILTLYHLEKINNNYLVRLAMLYHDVGKPEQYAAYSPNPDKNEIRTILWWELNHRVSSPQIAKKEFGALGFSKKELQEIMRYISEHHTPWEILMARKSNRTKKLRKLYSDWGFERVNNLLDITIADRQGQYNPLQNSNDITDVEELRTLLHELKNKEGQFTTKNLSINGQDIIEYFKIPAGPQIGELLQKAFLWVANNIAERNHKKIILKYLETIKK